jgi:enoyl-[acyl-carrier protein] reductase II
MILITRVFGIQKTCNGVNMINKITKMLKIKHPILQGGMVWISNATLATAVSNAGGAGIIGAGGHDAAWVTEEIHKARKTTNNPFGVNIPLMTEDVPEIVSVVCRERPAFVTLGGGNPIPYINQIKQAGIICIPVVASLYQAKKVEKAGADAIIAEGMEAGGHIGKMTTIALMTNIVNNIQIPVIAAGGIADQRGFKAVLAMGAQGIQMGSRFLLSEECPVHFNVKKKIMNATDTDTEILGYTIGHSVRVIQNEFAKDYLSIEYSDAPRLALKGKMKGVSYRALIEGDVVNGLIQVGQSLNVLNDILTCKDIISSMMEGIE